MLIDSAFNLIKTAWNSISAWLFNIFDAMGAWSYIMGSIFAMLVIRNLVYPAMKEGVGASDRVRKRSK